MGHALWLSQPPPREAFLQAPRARIETEWSGRPLQAPLEYSLAFFPGGLALSGSIARELSSLPGQRPEFQAGLWQGDVVELFLGQRDSEEYLELNWWAQHFGSYRKASQEQTCESLEPQIYSLPGKQSWQFYLSLELALPPVEQRTCNVSAIFGSHQRDYLTACPPPEKASEADFHLSALRRPPLLLPAFFGSESPPTICK